MGMKYYTRTAAWATYADGRALVGPDANFALVDARIDALDNDALEAVTHERYGYDLAEFGALYGNLDVDTDHDAAMLVEAGAREVRALLKEAVRELATGVTTSFATDGVRWTVTAGGNSWDGSNLPDEYWFVDVIAACGLFDAPLDAPTFEDQPALVAMVVLLDDVAAKVARAYAGVDLAPGVREQVAANLEAARLDVAGAARLLRSTMNRIVTQRRGELWVQFNQDAAGPAST